MGLKSYAKTARFSTSATHIQKSLKGFYLLTYDLNGAEDFNL